MRIVENGPILDGLRQAAAEAVALTPATVKAAILGLWLRSTDLAKRGNPPLSWLWEGYLARGKVTIFTAQWKAGKTTLISVLLQRMCQGGQLAGLAVAPARIAVVSEESVADWDARCQKLHIGDHVSFLCRPFTAKPTTVEWQGLIGALLERQRTVGLDLIVIDCLATFLPGHNENAAGPMMDSLLPLRVLTDAGISILLLHHPAKGVNLPGQAARGTGALPGHVDIVIEMYYFGRPEDDADRRRRLLAFSREEATRRHMVIELTADGADYLVPEGPMEEASAECWSVVTLVLEAATERLTRQQILEQWPEYYTKPNMITVYRALRLAVIQGKVLQAGSGRRNDPHRFWIPGKEEDFYPGLGAPQEEIDRWHDRWLSKLDGKTGTETATRKEDTAESGAGGSEDMPPPVQASEPVPPPAPTPAAVEPAPAPPAPAGTPPRHGGTLPPPNLVEYTDPEVRKRLRRYPYG